MPSYTLAIRNARQQVIADAIDAGSAGGKFKCYTGTSPGIANAATGTLLGICTFSASCGTVADGALTFSAITDGVGLSEGTVGYVRCTDSDDNKVVDMTAGTTGSGKEVIFTNINIVVGGTIRVDTTSGASKLIDGNA